MVCLIHRSSVFLELLLTLVESEKKLFVFVNKRQNVKSSRILRMTTFPLLTQENNYRYFYRHRRLLYETTSEHVSHIAMYNKLLES